MSARSGFTASEQQKIREALQVVAARANKRAPSLMRELTLHLARGTPSPADDARLLKQLQRFMNEGRDSRDGAFLAACLDYVSGVYPGLLDGHEEPVSQDLLAEIADKYYSNAPPSGFDQALDIQDAERNLCGVYQSSAHQFQQTPVPYGHYVDEVGYPVRGPDRLSRLCIRKSAQGNNLIVDEYVSLRFRENATDARLEADERIVRKRTGALCRFASALWLMLRDDVRRIPVFYILYGIHDTEGGDPRVLNLIGTAMEFTRSCRVRGAYTTMFMRSEQA